VHNVHSQRFHSCRAVVCATARSVQPSPIRRRAALPMSLALIPGVRRVKGTRPMSQLVNFFFVLAPARMFQHTSIPMDGPMDCPMGAFPILSTPPLHMHASCGKCAAQGPWRWLHLTLGWVLETAYIDVRPSGIVAQLQTSSARLCIAPVPAEGKKHRMQTV
jgi:hypothetical protein